MFGIFIFIAIIGFLYINRKGFLSHYKKLRYILKTWVLVFMCMLFTSVCIPKMVLRGKHYSNGRLGASYLKYVSNIFGIEWRLRDGHILEKDQGCIIVCNHQTLVDMLGFFYIWEVPKKVVIVAKKTIMYAGTFGLACYLSNTVFVDRRNPKEGYKKLEETTELMVNHKEELSTSMVGNLGVTINPIAITITFKKDSTVFKVKIWVFPEGTRNTQRSEKILPFKKGAFNMAVAAQVPIIPLVYSPYTFIDANKYEFGKGYVIMQCLEPIPTTGLTMEDVPALSDHVHGIMVKAFEELSEEISKNNR